MLGSFFKPNSYYVFDYKPRYYDPRKERHEQMKKNAGINETKDLNSKLTINKDNLRKDWARHKKSDADRKSAIRLAIIITILVAIFAYFLEIHKLF
jgi:hypothetical protein